MECQVVDQLINNEATQAGYFLGISTEFLEFEK